MFNEEHQLTPLRWAMVGGGRGSEIGHAHRAAAQRDGLFQLVAGAFDLDAERGRDFGSRLGVDAGRCYPDYASMLRAEAVRDDGIQAVSIATPNSTHYAIGLAALKAGLHVICEKPVTFTVAEAQQLKAEAQARGLVFGVMYGYSGYPMLHQARAMVQAGELGDIRLVNMQFAHGFHSQPVEQTSSGARWRTSPAVSGPTYVLGDLGTHTFHLGQFITGLKVERLLCHRQSFVATRAPLEDNAQVLLQYQSGAVGSLWASAVNAGSMHQQKIRIVGERASLEWWDEYPNQLRHEVQNQPVRILERGMGYLATDDPGVACSRIGGGHAEGFFESWANLYHRYALAMHGAASGLWYPDIDDGIEGVRLLECCVESADNDGAWVAF
ncbi:Gfo/Idh/MocA family protein [Halomonas litopenaei]|uniref:Gfo/Idh/MocA family protein n=1 Tax=Halomonas litopenaei TaxID=2109328 RepID=UPI003FA10B1A